MGRGDEQGIRVGSTSNKESEQDLGRAGSC